MTAFKSITALACLMSLSGICLADNPITRAADNIILEGISKHKPNYFLPLTWRTDQDDIEESEFIFQFSAKIEAIVPQLYFAYTQTAFWRFLDSDNSSPFRETNHNPEIFYEITPEQTPAGNWGSYLGFEHISNGQSVPDSRSLNRIYFWPYWKSNHGDYNLKLWYRIPEEEKESPTDPEGDDNPDLYRFLGYGEFYFTRNQSNGRSFSGMVRGNPTTGKGAIQLDYSWPLPNQKERVEKSAYFFARLFSGYGESLIDYNNSVTRLSFGFSFR